MAFVVGVGLTALVCSSSPAFAQAYLGGNLTPFALVGGSTITCTGSTLTTAGNVLMTNGGNPCGVQWRVGTSATLGLGSQMVGNVLAQSSITLVNGANLIGRALARTGAVTLDNNRVSFATCGAVTAPPPFPPAPVPTLTQGAMIALTLLLMAAGAIALRRKRSHELRVKRS